MQKVEGKPIFRWAGSKRKLLPVLLTYWGSGYDRYVEPFAGSACLFFSISPRRALLSDLNQDLISAYTTIANHPRAVYNRLCKMPRGKRSYYKLRAQSANELHELDRAARFIFLNRFCFNGLYRTNLSGLFNVPYSPSKTGDLATWEELFAASKILSKAKIVHGDFEDVLIGLGEGDFVYLDPPYAVERRRLFREYDPKSFTTNDIDRLAASLPLMDKRGVKFLVSYADCSASRKLAAHWQSKRVYTQRNISGFSKFRRLSAEVLISNFQPGAEARDVRA